MGQRRADCIEAGPVEELSLKHSKHWIGSMITSNRETGMTTQTFADYVAQDACNTIELNVRKYTLMLCDALEQNFKSRNHGTVGRYRHHPTSL